MSGMKTDQPRTKEDLLARIAQSWEALNGAIGDLTHEQLTTTDGASGWSIKDEIYHLAAWQRRQLAMLRGTSPAAALGIDEEQFNAHDTDAINVAVHERGREVMLGDALAALETAYRELQAEIEISPDDKLFGPAYPDDPAKGRVVDYIAGNTYEHFDEHRATIEGRK